jgi:hypothetical protein
LAAVKVALFMLVLVLRAVVVAVVPHQAARAAQVLRDKGMQAVVELKQAVGVAAQVRLVLTTLMMAILVAVMVA